MLFVCIVILLLNVVAVLLLLDTVDFSSSLYTASADCHRLGLNANLFKGKKVLEIGAGNALCGVTVASTAADSFVTLSDFNEVVLNNIESIVELNSGDYHMTYCGGGGSSMPCLGPGAGSIEVRSCCIPLPVLTLHCMTGAILHDYDF